MAFSSPNIRFHLLPTAKTPPKAAFPARFRLSKSVPVPVPTSLSRRRFPCSIKTQPHPPIESGDDTSSGAGGPGNGNFPPGSGGGGNDGSGSDGSPAEGEFGPVLNYSEVVKEIESRAVGGNGNIISINTLPADMLEAAKTVVGGNGNIISINTLPADMLEAAKTVGLEKVLLIRYLDLLQGAAWPLGTAVRSCSMLRNRMLADPSFLFKIGTEIVIDSCCATLAEVQTRGKDFWAEFELYTADLLVGVVVNVALVGMLAPYARIGRPAAGNGVFGRIAGAYAGLPSSVFEAERPGYTFKIQQRIGTYFFKGFLYGFVGFTCGLVGQGIANSIMTMKRNVKKSEEDVPIPPLVKSAVLWGVFLAVSSNTRYQIINGMERLVEASPIAKRVPPVAMAFTVGVRLANNIYGGMQFVDWARWSGVQ